MHPNQRAKIKIVQDLTQRYYETGNQRKCYKAIWRNYIMPNYPMSYRTYLNYISTPLNSQLNGERHSRPQMANDHTDKGRYHRNATEGKGTPLTPSMGE